MGGRLDFNIDVGNFTKFQSLLSVVGADIGLKTALTTAAIAVQGIARKEAPVRTGRLTNSIGYKIEGMKATISPKVTYGLYVEMGTGLYGPKGQLIYPKSAKVLATKQNPGWGAKSGAGYFVIGKYSRGQEANPFMERTAKLSMPAIETAFGMVPLGIAKKFTEI